MPNKNRDIAQQEQLDEHRKNNQQTSHKIVRSTGVVGIMTMLSRVLGFVRDMVCAKIFGAGASYDAFIVAFKIPNFLRRLFAEGAFAQAFVPILSEYRATRSKESIDKLLRHVAGVLGIILLIVSVLGMLCAPFIIRLFAPGFIGEEHRFYLSIDLLRITFPYIFFISLTAFLGSILNTFDKFAMPALTPVLLNLTMIISAIMFAQYFNDPIQALAWGVFVGGIVQLLFLLFFVRRNNLFPKPALSGDHDGVKRIMTNMLPALFGVSVAQINLLFDTVFASFLPQGSISWLYYSDRLMEFPLGVFGVALSTVVLPHLSMQYSKKHTKEFEFTLDWTLQLILLIVLPATLGLFILAEPLLVTLFHYGKFSAYDVYQSSLSLRAFASGLIAFVSIKILASAHYARKDIKTPVKIATVCMVVNVLLSLILMQFFYHTGLAMAGSITGFLNAGLLLATLIKRDIYKPVLAWQSFALKVLLANVVWVVLLQYFLPATSLWLEWSSMHRAAVLLIIIGIVMLLYFIVLRLLGFNFKKQLTLH
jgi:putative peptidoglycan lipid II flippase